MIALLSISALAGNVQLETFDHVVARIPEVHPDPIQGWEAKAKSLRKTAKKARDAEGLRPTLTALIETLGESHFQVVGPSSGGFDYGPGLMAGGSVGLSVAPGENGFVVFRVESGSAADEAGLLPGEGLVAVGDHALAPLHEAYAIAPGPLPDIRARGQAHSWLDGFENTTVDVTLASGKTIELQRRSDGVLLTPAAGEMPAVASIWSDRSIPLEGGEATIRLIRLEIFSAPTMLKFVEAMGRTKEDAAIVLDLRGNPGGIIQMGRGVAGFFASEKTTLGTMRTKTADLELVVHPRPVTQRFDGPLAILVDTASGSTSEVLAAAFQESGRARVFGTRTAGMALPSQFETLPNGDTLQLAIGDLHTPRGARIEGKGVLPDVVVELPRQPTPDPVLAAALKWLGEEVP